MNMNIVDFEKVKCAIVLLSGGLDSTTLLAYVRHSTAPDTRIVALNVSYGQKHIKELDCARKQAYRYNADYIQTDLSQVFQFSKDCALLNGSITEMPQGSYDEQLERRPNKPVDTYVPFRNGLLLSYATAVALQMNASVIFYGAHADDTGESYPDCSDEFITYMSGAVFVGSGKQIAMSAPFKGMNKAAVVDLGHALGVDFSNTWSCYEGTEHPCGKCGTCIDRHKAFELNRLVDPLEQ